MVDIYVTGRWRGSRCDHFGIHALLFIKDTRKGASKVKWLLDHLELSVEISTRATGLIDHLIAYTIRMSIGLSSGLI